MKRLMTWVLCTMMCFSTAITSITPVTVLAKCAHKHTQWVKLVNTTCTKDGKTVYVYNDCNKTLKVVKTRHYGHKFVNYYVAPTCKKGGASGQYCKRCRKRTITRSYPAKGHNCKIQTSPATCTNPKIEIKTCIRCGAKWGSTKGKALGHKWRKWTVDPVSLLRGHKARLIRTCSRCGKKDYRYK